MEVFDRRRQKLIEMLEKISAADLSRKSGVSPSYISRCLKRPGEDGYKTIGEITARKLELGGKKPEGWLDGLATSHLQSLQPPSNKDSVNSGSSLARFFEKLPQDTAIRNEVFVRCLDIIGEYLPNSDSAPSRMHVERVAAEIPGVTRPA